MIQPHSELFKATCSYILLASQCEQFTLFLYTLSLMSFCHDISVSLSSLCACYLSTFTGCLNTTSSDGKRVKVYKDRSWYMLLLCHWKTRKRVSEFDDSAVCSLKQTHE